MAIINKIGAPVTGENFYGRTVELIKAHRYLDEGQSFLLSAPRRIGKTSLAKRLIDDKSGQNWRCIYIDLQGVATKEAFLVKLISSFTRAEIMEKTKKKVTDFVDSVFKRVDGVDLGIIKVDLNHRGHLESLYNRLSDTFDYTTDTLIVIDELPHFLGQLMDKEGCNRDEVEFMLNWFRSIRQHENSRLRWIFCGSVGLRNFTNHYRMSQAINDLIDFELGELPDNEAVGLMRALADSYKLGIDDALIIETLELLQWPIPYFIQLLIDKLISKMQACGNDKVTIEDVKLAIDELSQSDYFRTWDDRLYEYRDLESVARMVLDNLSTAEEGLSKDSLLQVVMAGKESTEEPAEKKKLIKVLEMLEHDGYIMRSGNNKRFRSPLLRKWWKYNFVD